MNIKSKLQPILWLSLGLLISPKLLAHGYQTAPYSRTAYVVDSGQNESIHYNPNQIANNLPGTLGNKTLKEIINYISETNGTGPLAFFKDYYNVKNDQLCAYAANNNGYLPLLNQALPENKMSKVSMDAPVQFKWGYTAWHNPSNNFVFITEYPVGKYKPNPSLNDLHFVCAVPASASGAWQCQLPTFSGDSKQVMVTLWQRVDPAGENFISCADVKVKEGIVVPPEKIWSLLEPKASWTSTLEQPKAGDLVQFTLSSEKQETGKQTSLISYDLSITTTNFPKWASVLAAKINNDTTHSKIVAVGELNAGKGEVIYNETDLDKNYVYLNNTVSDSKLTYRYSLIKKQDPNPIIIRWEAVGKSLKKWIDAEHVKEKDQLQFSLQVAGIEQTLKAVTVGAPEQAEELVAETVNNAHFDNDLKVQAGVLQGSGDSAYIQFVNGGDNKVYVQRSTDETTPISYVIRNLTLGSNYPLYPQGMGGYKVGNLVQDENGQVYICLEAGWCNKAAYGLNADTTWKAVVPKPAPGGYLTYPAGKPYTNGSIVADVEGNLYQCTQAAWCNNQSGVYLPGMGRAWQDAWNKK